MNQDEPPGAIRTGESGMGGLVALCGDARPRSDNGPAAAARTAARPGTGGPTDLWSALGSALSDQQQGPELTPLRRDKPLLLSFAQQRLWFLQQAAPENAAYNVPLAWRIAGPLDSDVLERSLRALVQRHEVFRTRIVTDEGQARQVIEPSGELQLHTQDLRGVNRGQREDEVTWRVEQEARKPFDLTHAPWLRATLYRLEPQVYFLLLVVHHVAFDGWSLNLLHHELEVCYQAFANGRTPALPALPIQYADYAVWQRRRLEGGLLARHLEYWKAQLAGNLPVLELPTDRKRPDLATCSGAVHRIDLPGETIARAHAARKGLKTTLCVVLLAALKAFLHRCTGVEDVIVAMPTANRLRPELYGLMGCFVNTLLVRTRVTAEISFQELVRRVEGTLLAALAHQDLPFDHLVAALRPDRGAGQQTLFRVMYSYFQMRSRGLRLPGLELRAVPVDNGTSKFDLEWEIAESPDGLAMHLEYNDDLFDAATGQRIARQFTTLLAHGVAAPALPIRDLVLIDKAERRNLIAAFNADLEIE